MNTVHIKLNFCCGNLTLVDNVLYCHFVWDSIPLNLLPLLVRGFVLCSGFSGLGGFSGVVT